MIARAEQQDGRQVDEGGGQLRPQSAQRDGLLRVAEVSRAVGTGQDSRAGREVYGDQNRDRSGDVHEHVVEPGQPRLLLGLHVALVFRHEGVLLAELRAQVVPEDAGREARDGVHLLHVVVMRDEEGVAVGLQFVGLESRAVAEEQLEVGGRAVAPERGFVGEETAAQSADLVLRETGVVDEDAQVDGGDGDEDAEERDGRELGDEADADEDHEADDDQKERPVDADVVVEDVLVRLEVPEQRHLRTQVVEQNLDGARDVHLGLGVRDRSGVKGTHGAGHRCPQEEENADRAAELRAQRAGDHEVRSARGNDAVGRDGRQRDGLGGLEVRGQAKVRLTVQKVTEQQRSTMKKKAGTPAVPVIQVMRMKMMTPKMF